MANIAFGYDNHCLKSGVTFTPSSEAAAHDADNLGKAHPSKFWRIATPAHNSNVNIDFGRLRGWDLVAPIYVTASPHQNMVKGGYYINDTDWTESNAAIAAGSFSAPLTGDIPGYGITATGGSASHLIHQSYTKTGGVQWDVAASLYLDISETADSANLEFRITDGAGNGFRVRVNGTTGAVNSSGAIGSGATLTSAASTLISGTVYRITLIGKEASAGTIRTEVQVLDSSFAQVYTPNIEGIAVGGITTELGTSVGTAINSLTGQASYWGESVTNFSDIMALPLARDHEQWSSNRGLISSYEKHATTQFGNDIDLFFVDVGNDNSQLDISNIYIGPTWSPAKNLHEDWSWEIDPETGARTLMLRILYASEAEAKADAIPMALTAGVGIKSAAVADGGQEFRRDRKPILVILDPDEATYAQEDMVYGFLDEFRVKAHKYVANMDGAGNSGLAYAIEMKIKEVLP